MSQRSKIQTPWPIIGRHHPVLNQETFSELHAISARYCKENPALCDRQMFGPFVKQGWSPAPTIYFEDHRVVDLISDAGAAAYEYRMLGLASDEDYYLVGSRRNRSFEHYLEDEAGLGSPTVIRINLNPGSTIASTASQNTALIDRFAKIARQHSGLNLIAYQSSADVWHLAKEIADRAQTPVWVAGPFPELTKKSNDKLWFAELAAELLGSQSIPTTHRQSSKSVILQDLRELSDKHDQLILKLPSSAGGVGNIRISSEQIRSQTNEQLFSTLSDLLEVKTWQTGQDVLVGVWDAHVTHSPSVQMWVPKLRNGLPIIEGIFEQLVIGSQGSFVGAKRADLPQTIIEQLCSEALVLATSLQLMGYYGRLSLDTVLIQSDDIADIHWIEANARWGGVSIPLTVSHRFSNQVSKSSPVIIQRRMDGELSEALAYSDLEQLTLTNGTDGFLFMLPFDGDVKLATIIGASDEKLNKLNQAIESFS